MFKIIHSMGEVCYSDLTRIYQQSLTKDALSTYLHYSPERGFMEAEQDFYLYIKGFLTDKQCFLALWYPEGRPESVLRCEPYRDGFLIEGLETAPESRGNGYAKALLKSVVAYLKHQSCGKIYSHIHKKNTASIWVHELCGFQKSSDFAVYIDGSVDSLCSTYLID